ncbi:MAG: hypothetical protein LQ350_004437 [Teloschistes chrysophthalmus]|nr:MAG: hypothetical protein LQ350_004437 [Niorma chrysophthalma]
MSTVVRRSKRQRGEEPDLKLEASPAPKKQKKEPAPTKQQKKLPQPKKQGKKKNVAAAAGPPAAVTPPVDEEEAAQEEEVPAVAAAPPPPPAPAKKATAKKQGKKKAAATGPPAAAVAPAVEEEATQEDVPAPPAATATAPETAPDAPAPAPPKKPKKLPQPKKKGKKKNVAAAAGPAPAAVAPAVEKEAAQEDVPAAPAPPPPPPPPAPPHQDHRRHRAAWRRLFAHKMNHHRSIRSADPLWEYHRFWHNYTWEGFQKAHDIRKPPVHQIRSTENLEGENIILAIASVWAAYNHRGHGKPFAFVDYNQLSLMRFALSDEAAADDNLLPAVDAAGGRNDLLVPLIFSRDEYDSPSTTPHELQLEHPKSPTPPPRSSSSSSSISLSDLPFDESAPPPPPAPPKKAPATHEEEQPKTPRWNSPKPGHILLGVASLTPSTSIRNPIAPGHHITLTTYDSLPGYMPASRIHRAIMRVVRRSHWPPPLPPHPHPPSNPTNPPTKPTKPPPTHLTLIPHPVPPQISPDSCGIHTILNAWILLLGLPSLPPPFPPSVPQARYQRPRSREEGGQGEEERFMRTALEVVNLALGGWMDGRTLQAFLVGWGCVSCLGGPPTGDGEGGGEGEGGWLVDDVEMKRMAVGILEGVLEEGRS